MASKLTKKQKGFANDYLDSGNGTQAVLKNYDTDNPDTAKVIASQNLTKLNVQAYIESKAGDASSMIYKLSQEAEGEPVRLSASKDILDRAGYRPVERSEVKTLNVDVKIGDPITEALRLEYEEKLKQKYLDTK